VSERDRGDRPKKSWRELDAQRDRAGAPQRRSDGPPPRAKAQEERASKQYRAALDELFAKGEVGKMAEKLINSQRSSPPMREMPAPKPAAPPAEAEAPKAPAPPPPEDPRQVLRKKILAALGRDEISRAVDKYVKAHGMPADFEVLEQALEHHKNERIVEALNVLDTMLTKDKPKRSRTLAGKLRFIEETSDDPELRAHAARVRGKLG
jgi:hypothetical protein